MPLLSQLSQKYRGFFVSKCVKIQPFSSDKIANGIVKKNKPMTSFILSRNKPGCVDKAIKTKSMSLF